MFKAVLLFTLIFSLQVRAATTVGENSLSMDDENPVAKIRRSTKSDYFYLPEARHSVVGISYGETTGKFNALSYGDFGRQTINIKDRFSDYSFRLNYALNSMWFVNAGSAFRSTKRSFSGPDEGGLIESNGIREYQAGLGFMRRFYSATVIGGLKYAYQPETSFRSSQNVISPHLGIEASAGGGVLGLNGQLDAQEYKYSEQWGSIYDSTPTSSTLKTEAFYEFPVARIVVVGAVAGIKKYLDTAKENEFLGRIYSSVNAIDNTAVTFELNSSNAAQGRSETAFNIGLRQSL